MDKARRSQLYTAGVKCRTLLEEDFTRQLEGTYGVHASGTFEPLASLTHLDAVGRADRQAIEAVVRPEDASGADCRPAGGNRVLYPRVCL
ncbi:MAG: hypothetical protein M5U01_33575 [Ardenticatenaceae bacterium]|nr:hypothetical protein [Ardenticatenaceae bacterium]HBY96836.1 hypothetical protein [Chloroflexota bacterium]